MKYLLFFIIILTSYGSFAGREAGNGGGVWVCYEKNQSAEVRWIKLVDLYEAEKEFFLSPRVFNSTDYQKILSSMKDHLLSVNKSLYRQVSPYFDKVESNLIEVEADLRILDDSLYRVKPGQRDCPNGEVRYEQLANFTKYGKILINKSLFAHPKLLAQDKAALIFHEVLYSYLRESKEMEDSVATRKVVGYLFSILSNQETKEEIESVVGYISGGLLGMDFVPIQAGSFMMGSPESEANRQENEQQRFVVLKENFEIMTTEVTQGMYFEVMKENYSSHNSPGLCPKSFQVKYSDKLNRYINICPDFPASNVSMKNVQKFIKLLNKKMGMNFRLPTEEEWEYAARAGSQDAYHFGNRIDLLGEYEVYDNRHTGDHIGSTPSVIGPLRKKSNKPNKWGLYDMLGNVSEWTSSIYSEAEKKKYVVRGGAYYFKAEQCRSANRLGHNGSHYVLGFRLVQTIP